jgi:8-amino-7-oxononanoate synthase
VSLFEKLTGVRERVHALSGGPAPFDTVVGQVCSPTEVIIAGRRTLMCGSNSYFGLNFHPEVMAAAHRALDRDGVATTGSRVANGTYSIHHRMEGLLAALFAKPHALVFTTGYQANLGIISGLCGPDDTVLLDMESHASLYDGARLSQARIYTFRHNNALDLARKLARLPAPSNCLVVVEGLYSISGDLSPLGDIVEVAHAAGACVLVDEAHSFGTYGAHGLGWAEEQGVLGAVDFVTGTFSKALVGVGGFAVSGHEALSLVRLTSRPYVFTSSGTPANLAAVEAALSVLEREPERRDRLWANVRRVRGGLTRRGFDIGSFESPIVSIALGDEARACRVWREVLEAGVYTNLVVPPGCAPGSCRLRTSYSAAHTPEQLDRALAVFEAVGRRHGVLGSGRGLEPEASWG